MPDPLIASGWFGTGRGGTLIRHQLTPKEEETEIGTRFLTQRRGDWENMLPIPDRMQPMLSALRGIVLGDPSALDAYDRTLTNGETGWTLHLKGAIDLSLSGCGDTLTAIDLTPSSGERRRIVFE